MASSQFSGTCHAGFSLAKTHVQEFAYTIAQMSHSGGGLFAFVIIAILALSYRPRSTKVDAPVIGKVWSWEPSLITGLRFLLYSRSILEEGYRRVSLSIVPRHEPRSANTAKTKYKDRAFIIRRLDTDIVVLPTKYLEELKSLPLSKISALEAQARVSNVLDVSNQHGMADVFRVWGANTLGLIKCQKVHFKQGHFNMVSCQN